MELGVQHSPSETWGPALSREELLALGVQEGAVTWTPDLYATCFAGQ